MNLLQRISHLILMLCVAVIAAAPLFTAQAAHADGSFLLQLGTFETHDEAAKKWADVKAANADLLGTLQGHVAEVMLPPDNTPTYRTQVGPVPSRKDAKKLCKSLESRNVTCFVVETAFAASDLSPEMAGDVSAPPTASAPAEPVQTASATAAITPPEQQISATPVAPIVPGAAPSIEVNQPASPAPSTAAVTAPEPSAAPAVVAEPVKQVEAPEPQDKEVAAEHSDNQYFNPNDEKKSGFFRHTFDLNSQLNKQAEVSRAEAARAPKQVAAASNDDDKPGFFGRLFGRSAPKEEQVAAAPEHVVTTPTYIKGDVQVAEAIRVPVTQDTAPTAETPRYVPVPVAAASAGDNELELDADGTGIYWVQVGYFANETEAHDFFVQLHGLFPQALDNVRIRITRPFATRNAKVSLRMGTFTSGADVKAICSDAHARGLRCTSIRDTTASAANTPATTAKPAPAKQHKKYVSPLEAVDIPGYHPPEGKVVIESTEPKPMVNIAAKSQTPGIAPTSQEPSPPPAQTTASYPPSVASAVANPAIGGQWLSLGGFATSQSAWNQWKALQSSVPALNDVKATITGALTRSTDEKYQLRAGPIVTDVDAENICKAIVATGNICNVSGGE